MLVSSISTVPQRLLNPDVFKSKYPKNLSGLTRFLSDIHRWFQDEQSRYTATGPLWHSTLQDTDYRLSETRSIFAGKTLSTICVHCGMSRWSFWLRSINR